MKKSFKNYFVIWVILIALFNLIAWVSPGWEGYEKYTPSFYLGYAFINAVLIGQLFVAHFALKEEKTKKTFMRFSLLSVSYAGLFACILVGALCMLISPLPEWIGAIVCAVVLALNILALLRAKNEIDLVEEVDERVAESTAFIREMSEESESLVAFAKSEEAKAWCKKVSEAFRYSDPVSVGELADIEFAIEQHFQAFAKAVREGEEKVLAETAEILLAEIASRNGKCKRTKSGARSRYTSSKTEKKS